MTGFSIRKNIRIEGKHGKPIIADIFIPDGDGPFPAVIFSHGFKGFKDWGPFNVVASQFASQGMVFIKINFAFNGTTPDHLIDFVDLDAFGMNNFTKELDDLDVTLNMIISCQQEFQIDVSNISLIGHSRGGGISILKSFEDDRIKQVAGWASVAGFDRHISKTEIINWKQTGVHYIDNARTGQKMPLFIQLYNDFMKNHRRFNIHQAVIQHKKPMLLAHASNDNTIPFNQISELQLQNPDFVRLIATSGGGHTFDAEHPFSGNRLPEKFQYIVNQTIIFLNAS